MDETKKWLDKVDKGGFKLWLVAAIALIAGLVGIFLLNGFVYKGGNPKINYLLIIFIIAIGYKLWIATAAAAASFGFLFGLFKTLFSMLLTKKMNNEELGDFTGDALEKKTMEIAASMRKGSRKFLWTGIFFGLIFGAINHIFMMKGSTLNGYLIFTVFGGAYGLFWYRLAWAGMVPVSSE